MKMVGFTDFLIEAVEKDYLKFIDSAETIHSFVETRFKYNRELVGKLIDGGSLKDFFIKCDECVKKMKEFIKTVNGNDKLTFRLAALAAENDIKYYEKLKENYKKLEEMYYKIHNAVKIGDDLETAILKLSRLTTSLRYFNIISGKEEGYYFKAVKVEDLRKKVLERQQCVLVGINSLTVKFNKNYKVIGVGL